MNIRFGKERGSDLATVGPRFRSPWRRMCLLGFAVSLGLTHGTLARAEPTAQDKARAEFLFRDGKKLLSQGRYAEACAKLGESYLLEPTPGTLLNVAVCHEQEGKTATAWAEFSQSVELAERDRRDDRAQLAREHKSALEPRLARLSVTISASAQTANLAVRVDQTALDKAGWGSALPVDPGPHVIRASAPGKKDWQTTIQVGPAPKTHAVEVPPLENAATTPAEPDQQVNAQSSHRGLRTAAYVAGGVGLAALGVGTVFALRSSAKNRESRDSLRRGRPVQELRGFRAESRGSEMLPLSPILDLPWEVQEW